jgi:hypothetical protein
VTCRGRGVELDLVPVAGHHGNDGRRHFGGRVEEADGVFLPFPCQAGRGHPTGQRPSARRGKRRMPRVSLLKRGRGAEGRVRVGRGIWSSLHTVTAVAAGLSRSATGKARAAAGTLSPECPYAPFHAGCAISERVSAVTVPGHAPFRCSPAFPQAGCLLRDPGDKKAVPLPFSFLPGNTNS